MISQNFKENITVKSLGKEDLVFNITMPAQKGEYEMLAKLKYNGEDVFGTRLLKIR